MFSPKGAAIYLFIATLTNIIISTLTGSGILGLLLSPPVGYLGFSVVTFVYYRISLGEKGLAKLISEVKMQTERNLVEIKNVSLSSPNPQMEFVEIVFKERAFAIFTDREERAEIKESDLPVIAKMACYLIKGGYADARAIRSALRLHCHNQTGDYDDRNLHQRINLAIKWETSREYQTKSSGYDETLVRHLEILAVAEIRRFANLKRPQYQLVDLPRIPAANCKATVLLRSGQLVDVDSRDLDVMAQVSLIQNNASDFTAIENSTLLVARFKIGDKASGKEVVHAIQKYREKKTPLRKLLAATRFQVHRMRVQSTLRKI